MDFFRSFVIDIAGNSERFAMFLLWEKIINHSQGNVDTLELYKVWKVRTA